MWPLAFGCLLFTCLPGIPNAFAVTPSATDLPTGGSIASGQAIISSSSAQMNITQGTEKAIINWSTFNVGSQAQVNFIQPSSTAQTLNRVVSGDASHIDGRISATGQIFLINPNGVVFGADAQVNAAGLIASTLNIADKDFENGNYTFERNSSTADITNEGTLTATSGGYIALLGISVTNRGKIDAPSGKVALAAGETVQVPLTDSGLITIEATAMGANAAITNEEGATISATEGQVHIAAEANTDYAAQLINEGIIDAGRVRAISASGSFYTDSEGRTTAEDVEINASLIAGGGTFAAKGPQGKVALNGGYVSLTGTVTADSATSSGGTVSIAGKEAVLLSDSSVVSANGLSGGDISITSPEGFTLISGSVFAVGSEGTGGTIKISGTNSTALLGAAIDASGKMGGGTILIGGGWHGAADIMISNSVTVDAASTLLADATTLGNGGDVVLWSNTATSFYGIIAARGGLSGGNGGNVEVSSASTLNVQITANHGIDVRARSQEGANGTITLDPANIVIGDPASSFDIFKALLSSSGTTASEGLPTPSSATPSNFGFSVALNDTYALIGVADPDGSGVIPTARGNAYLYDLTTGVWTDLSTTSGQPITALASNANFGYSVALNSTYALIGATYVSTKGNAYLYNLTTGEWTNLSSTTGQPISALGQYCWFGAAVTLNEDYALMGAWGYYYGRGNAYLYNLTTGGWTNLSSTSGQPITGLARYSYVGEYLALNSTYALIPAWGVSSGRGNAYLYNLTTGAWTNLATTAGQPITALASYTNFGRSVAMSETYALMGALEANLGASQGDAYLYNLITGEWTDLSTTAGEPITALSYANFGQSTALNDSYAMIGATNKVYLYDLTNGAWTTLSSVENSPITTSYQGFGLSMALNDTYALLGAQGQANSRGNAYLYNLLTGAWTNLAATVGQPVTGLASTSAIGNSVALNGTYALMGTVNLSSNRGDAFLYNLSTGSWIDLATTSSQPITALSSNSYFGTSVALNSGYALIGATGLSANRGNAYLYNIATGGWTDLSTTMDQPITALESDSKFGTSVALNGSYALIGAYGASSYQGDAFLYDLSLGAWTTLSSTTGELVTLMNPYAYFGYSVALNNSYALIGAIGVSSNQGSAFLYNLSSGAWTDLAATSSQPITALSSNSYFGSSVALNSSYSLISAQGASTYQGNAYLYNLTTGIWTDLSTTADEPITALSQNSFFGSSVALNGAYALIGADGVSSYKGTAYLYDLSTGAWTNLAETTGQPITALASNAFFGTSVALNSTYALIGAPNAGSAYEGTTFLYNLTTGSWTDLESAGTQPITSLKQNSSFGTSVALNETYALIGAKYMLSNLGDAFLYNLATGKWTDLAATSGAPAIDDTYAYFGYSVALNDTYALIGAPYAGNYGNAFLYNIATGAWTDLSLTSGEQVSTASFFGDSVALNGTYALIGAEDSANHGNAYLYNLSTGDWTNLAETTGEPITALGLWTHFGSSVAINDSYALIGARSYASSRGNAYLYNLATGEWTDLSTTSGELITTISSYSYFAYSVALNDSYALMGAYWEGIAGNAYLYNLSTGAWMNLSTTSGQPITALSFANFGYAVALNDAYALIGAPAANSYKGGAYLYNLSTGTWTNLASTSGQPITALAEESNFGTSVALNNSYALIGDSSAYSGRGNAYLYFLTGGWKNLSSNSSVTSATSSAFGYSVALSDSYALIGARTYSSSRGNAYLYNLTTGTWTDFATTPNQPISSLGTSSYFGTSVALNDDYALIGASGVSTNRGNAYLYDLETGAWTDLSATADAPITALASSSYFGFSVALNSDYALFGAYGVTSNRGNAYLYNLSGGWTALSTTDSQPITTLLSNSYFGYSVALNDRYALMGAYGVTSSKGNAYLYDLSGGWTPLSSTDDQPVTTLANSSYFGYSVALNNTYALIGAYGVTSSRGNAFLYNLSGGWTTLSSTDGQPIAALLSSSRFGSSVALNDDYALIGAYGVTSSRGNAFLYDLTTGGWTDLSTVTGQPITALSSNAYFGRSVALNEDYALIGAYGATTRGQAYLISLGPATTMTLSSDMIMNGLAGGNYQIVADNNITIQTLNLSDLSSENSLTLQAGKSIIVQTEANFGDRAVTLLANAASSLLGSSSNRTSGAGSIVIESGASLNNPEGSIILEIGTASDSERLGEYAFSGDFSLDGDITAETLLIMGNESATNVTASLSASSTGVAITLSTRSQTFSGNGTLSVANGNWLIYNANSESLGTIALNTMTRDFNRYGCTFTGGCTTGAVIPTEGNGVVYAYAPTLIVTLASNNKTYDSTPAVILTGASISGIANEDSISLSGSYATANVGNDIPITYTLSTAYGYVLPFTTGDITPASLRVTPQIVRTRYDGSLLDKEMYSTDLSNYTFGGLQGSDTVEGIGFTLSGTMAFNGSTSTLVRNADYYIMTTGSLLGTDTNGNYSFVFSNPASNGYLIGSLETPMAVLESVPLEGNLPGIGPCADAKTQLSTPCLCFTESLHATPTIVVDNRAYPLAQAPLW